MSSEPVVSMLVGELMETLDKYSGAELTTAEAIGALEIVKMSLMTGVKNVEES